MPRKTPIGKIKSAALGTIKDPVGAAGKAAGRAVGQARDSVALGRTVADHVTRGASEAVLARLPLPGREQHHDAAPAPSPTPASAPSVRERAVPAETPLKDQGDALATPAPPKPAPAAKKSPAKKAPAKKTPAKKTTAKKAPAKKAATAIDAAADTEHVDVTPADVAKSVAKKAPAKTSTTKKTAATKAAADKTAAPGDKLPARKSATKKSAAKKTPARKTAAKKAPLTAAEVAAGAGTETITPVGTRGADVATNPDTNQTDLQQPGTEPLVDSSLTKSVAKESGTLAKASDPDKG